MKKYKPAQLKVLDWSNRWFWMLIYYKPYSYGEPWLTIEIFEPIDIEFLDFASARAKQTARLKRTWFKFWHWISTGDQENTNSY